VPRDGEVSEIHIFFASVAKLSTHRSASPPWLSLAMASNVISVRLAAGCMACVKLQLSWIKCRNSPHRMKCFSQ
jgi:hypothetical protein